jgi:hypothetical protein
MEETMHKGASFELQIKEAIECEILRGRLGINPSMAKTFLHKRYWSPDRHDELVTDVSLEISRSGASQPYLIWIWECKDYGRAVPVDDVEEFHAKLEQIGLHRIKGTIACRNGFQSGAVVYARTKGIGLALLRKGNIVRLIESQGELTEKEVDFGLSNPESNELTSLFYGVSTRNQGFLRISELIDSELVNGRT